MATVKNKEKIKTILTRAVSNVLVFEHLEKALLSEKKLRIKLGIDPTAPDIHLGHSVPLIKLKQFQELGHQAVLIIGDFTAQIGDPSGRTESRKALSAAEVKRNMKNYLKQAGKIIDIKKTEIRHNSEWFSKMKAVNFYELAGKVTVQQILKREDFKKRMENDKDITANEMMYPIFQGYDSVMVKADVEIGGDDQLVNLLMGRRIQRAYNLPEQDILTTWLIEGTDGERKMSKSFNNYIAISEKPSIIFGKIMSIPDSLIIKYFRALTSISDKEIEKFESDIKSKKANPRDIKSRLAFEIVNLYHGKNNAEKAEKDFNKTFRKHEFPKNIDEVSIILKPYPIIELLIHSGLALSKSEARRLVLANAAKINGNVINDINAVIDVAPDMIVQVGKRHFKKIKAK